MMKVLIADDHPIFRSGLKFLIHNSYPDATVYEFDNGIKAENSILEIEPNFTFLDIDMPGKNGLDVCKSIQDKSFTKVIILTMYNDGEMLKKALDNGADAFLVKDNTSDELAVCMDSLQLGETYISRSMRKSDKIQKELKHYKKLVDKLHTLTDTELKTLDLVAQNYSTKEIAELLFVSSKSIENYRSRICKKLNINTKNTRLIGWAIENKRIIDEVKK